MLYVSIFVELLRSRPALAVWLAALAQAVLWVLLPSIFYVGPPGDLPFVLAIGHEFQLGTYLGPPLAFWLAEAAYFLAGNSLIGIYVLSQICVVMTYWAVFALGRAIVGAQHAALAVLLMVGISAYTVPTPDFGPVTLTMALWAIILLHFWRAVGEGRRGYWVALAIEIGLLMLTTYAGLLLLGMLVLFIFANRRARGATLRSSDPWFAILAAAVVLAPHLIWLTAADEGLLPKLMRLRSPEAVVENFNAWLRLVAFVLAAHAGLAVLVSLVVGWPWAKREPAPVIVREPVEPFGRQFVYFFALVPMLMATFVAVLAGWTEPVGGIAPLVILSGLAVIVAVGDGIELSQQHVVISAWFGLLLAPPVLAIISVLMLPWFGIDLNVGKPARPIAEFFADSFQRRTGTPLQIVAGDPRTAALVSLGSARPSLLLDATPDRSPWVTFDDIRARGAIVVWPTTDTAGTPPPAIKGRFPELVPEVPQDFERPIRGRLQVLRIGWAVIRPQRAATDAAPVQPPPQ